MGLKMLTCHRVPRAKTAARCTAEFLLPLFYIHMHTPDGLEEDDLGIEFPDIECAYLETYRAIPEMVADLIRQGVEPSGHAFIIANAAGAVLMEVPLSEPLRIRPEPPSGRSVRVKRL